MVEEETASGTDDGGKSGPFSGRWAMASMALLVAIAVAGAAVSASILLGDDDEPSQEELAQEGQIGEDEAPETDPPRSDGSQSVCGLKESEKDEFTDLPDDTSWDFAGTTQAPSSKAHGPGKTTEEGYRYCYAKSPEGAAFTAMNFVAMTTDPRLAEPIVTEMVAEGPGKEEAQKQMEKGDYLDATGRLRVDGVRLLAYGADRARVDLALWIQTSQNQGLVSYPVDLRWEEGDWRIVTGDDGGMVIPASPLNDLTGFTATEVEDPQQSSEQEEQELSDVPDMDMGEPQHTELPDLPDYRKY